MKIIHKRGKVRSWEDFVCKFLLQIGYVQLTKKDNWFLKGKIPKKVQFGKNRRGSCE